MSIAISKDVQAAYESIRQEKSGQAWAVFAYDGASDLKVQAEGEDLDELADEFSDGKLQYAFLRVTGKSSNLPKLVLVGWCGEGAARKGSFQTHFASVAKQLTGYHVQITARSAEDVAADSIVKKVEDASGAKYTPAAGGGGGVGETTPKRSTNSLVAQLKKGQLGKTEPRLPTAAPKPAFASKPSAGSAKKSEDEWAPKSKPAAISQPTRQNDSAPQTSSAQSTQDKVEPVKSTYTPIGAPDIAALRAQGNSDRSASKSTQSRPEAAGTSYEPAAVPETGSLKDRMAAFKQAASSPSSDGGATKTEPKKTNPLASRFGAGAAAGSRSGIVPATGYESKALGGMSRNFGSEGGKTPAQLWAERKARERGEEVPEHVAPAPVKATVYGDRDNDDEDDKADVSAVRDRLAGASIKQAEPEADEEEDDEPAQPPPPPMNTRPQAAKAAVRAPSPEPEPEPEPEEEEDVHEPEPEPEAAAPKPMENSIKAQLERQLGAGSSPAKGPPAETQRAAAAAPKAKAKTQDQGQRARVTFDYEADDEGELSLVEGAIITHIDQVDEGWWQGRDASGAEGLFPANYVELIGDDDEEAGEADEEEVAAPTARPTAAAASSAPPAVEAEEGAHVGDSAVAVYAYEAAEEGEIGFAEGETITHIDQVDEGWWQGRNAKGEEGLFPATYVELQ